MTESLGALARDEAGAWFPGMDGPRTRITGLQSRQRPRCVLHFVELDDGRSRRPVVVKVRHSVAHLRRVDRFPDRPVLAPDRTVSDGEAARLEFEGLRLLEGISLAGPPGWFGAVRPLALLPGHSAIVMTRSEEPTLRDRLLSTPSLASRREPAQPLPAVWRRAGMLLRRYHESGSALPQGERLADRAALLALAERYGGFLGDRLGDTRFFTEVAGVAAVALGELPERLPLGVDHGDFVTRNIFAAPDGRTTVFDPMPLWRAPVYEDMARLVMAGLRVLDVQAYSQGLAFPAPVTNALEQAFLAGYYPDGALPQRAVRAYQLLVLLDRWAARASKDGLSGRRRRRAALVALSGRHLRREALRLVRLLSDDRVAQAPERR